MLVVSAVKPTGLSKTNSSESGAPEAVSYRLTRSTASLPTPSAPSLMTTSVSVEPWLPVEKAVATDEIPAVVKPILASESGFSLLLTSVLAGRSRSSTLTAAADGSPTM